MLQIKQKRYSFFYLIGLLLLISCSLSVKREGPEIEREMKRSYYTNGTLEYESTYFNDRLDGYSKYWDDLGSLISHVEYMNGQPHGFWNTYYNNGQVKISTVYFHGKKHGEEKSYYENGQLKSLGIYVYDQLVEDIVRWKKNGDLIY